jgi:predicted AAA+ superfamily ATPase
MMTYRTRFLEQLLGRMVKSFPAVAVTGPRQSGKTSLLLHLGKRLYPKLDVVSFDAPSDIDAFRRDPALFFANHPGVLFLDEIQHVPDIFPYLKKELDRRPSRFRFFLSGSQPFHFMRHVSESLAGRIAVLDLWPFCDQEAGGAPDRCSAEETIQFLENPGRLKTLEGKEFPCNDRSTILPAMLKGGYPPVVVHHAGSEWLESYRRTYIQRDIRELSQIADLGRFDRFTVLMAGWSGTLINKAEVGRLVGVDNKTVDHWLSLLENSYQLIAVPPCHRNVGKRLVKRPKYYFADIGLGLHLQGIRDGPALLSAHHFGCLFETFIAAEIRKLFGHAGRPWDAFFWRTSTGCECDLVFSAQGNLVPVEIKHAATPQNIDLQGLREFLAAYARYARAGLLLSLHPRVERLAANIWNFPIGLLLNGV